MAPTASTHQGPPSPWRNSTAKKQLYDDIVKGKTKGMKTSTDVYRSRPIYQRYALKNFQSNYRGLKNKIEGRMKSAEAGRKAFAHDHAIVKKHRDRHGSLFYYNGSLVQKRLKRDVQRNKTYGKTPAEVQASRPQLYQTMPLKKFASHLWYERHLHQRNLLLEDYRERMEFVNARIDPDRDEMLAVAEENGE